MNCLGTLLVAVSMTVFRAVENGNMFLNGFHTVCYLLLAISILVWLLVLSFW
jgi:hypothetical protein